MVGAFCVSLNGGGAAFVSGEWGVSAVGAGEHPEFLLDREDHCQGWGGI